MTIPTDEQRAQLPATMYPLARDDVLAALPAVDRGLAETSLIGPELRMVHIAADDGMFSEAQPSQVRGRQAVPMWVSVVETFGVDLSSGRDSVDLPDIPREWFGVLGGYDVMFHDCVTVRFARVLTGETFDAVSTCLLRTAEA